MDSKEFQKTVLTSLTRLEKGQVELKESYAKLDEKIDFVHHDLNTKIELIANALKQLVEKIDTLVERMITREENERRVIGINC
jgi:DNA anti-recombination protein RmuC